MPFFPSLAGLKTVHIVFKGIPAPIYAVLTTALKAIGIVECTDPLKADAQLYFVSTKITPEQQYVRLLVYQVATIKATGKEDCLVRTYGLELTAEPDAVWRVSIMMVDQFCDDFKLAEKVPKAQPSPKNIPEVPPGYQFEI